MYDSNRSVVTSIPFVTRFSPTIYLSSPPMLAKSVDRWRGYWTSWSRPRNSATAGVVPVT